MSNKVIGVLFALLFAFVTLVTVKDIRDANARAYTTSEISEIVDIKQLQHSTDKVIIVRTKDDVLHFKTSEDYFYFHNEEIKIGNCVQLSIKVIGPPTLLLQTTYTMSEFVACPEGMK
jgi:hypothetical protein